MAKKVTSQPRKSKFDLTKFRFVNDTILLKPLREEEVNGLVKPEQYDDKSEFGVVIAIGAGKLLDNGTRVPPSVKPGDTVFFGKYTSEHTRSNGQDYYLVHDEDIRAVI